MAVAVAVAVAVAKISVWQAVTPLTTTTDFEGKFELSATWPGLRGRQLRAVSEEGRHFATTPMSRNEIAPSLHSFRLELRPAQVVNVQVVDDAGQPVHGATCGLVTDNQA